MPEDFYDLFEIHSDASQDEVESAYRSLVKDYHPDRNDSPDAEEKFKTIQKAYNILTDEKERHKYDELGHSNYVRSYIASGSLDGFEFTDTAEPDTHAGGNTQSSTTSTQTQRSTESSPSSTETSDSTTETATTDPVDIPFRPKVHRSIVVAVSAITTVLVVYLYGVTTLAFANQRAIRAFLAELVGTPSETFEFTFDQPPVEFIGLAVTNPLGNIGAVVFLLGVVALPVTAAAIVWKLGGKQPSLWLYVVGALVPSMALGVTALTGLSLPAFAAVVVYLGIPVITVAVFIVDVLSYIIRKYIEFYVAYYNLDRFLPS